MPEEKMSMLFPSTDSGVRGEMPADYSPQRRRGRGEKEKKELYPQIALINADWELNFTSMKRKLAWFFGAVVLLLFAGLGYGFWLGHSRERGYERVMKSDSEQRVIALLGRPAKITGPPDNVAWDETNIHPNKGECVREFWYAPPLTICGEAWTVGFDQQGEVVSKYHYYSP